MTPEDASGDLTVQVGVAAISLAWRRHTGGRCHRCGGGGRQRQFLRRRDRWSHPRTDLRLFGFDSLSSPLEWRCGRGPCRSSVCPEVIAVLFSRPERRSLSLLLQWSVASHPEFVVPQAPRCGGCSYPREWNRSSVCNGTLSAGVCSLWLSRPEHLGI
jgi:hypothetical protein